MESAPETLNVLTIAGTDPSGAAGIQVDLQVIRDFGCHGLSVITSVLAQNTVGVSEVEAMSPSVVRAQLDTLLDDIDVDVVKIGLLPTVAVVETVADVLSERRREMQCPIVLDPVFSSGDGDTILVESGVQEKMVESLFHMVGVLTPNIREAEALIGWEIEDVSDLEKAAAKLARMVAGGVVLKVGHFEPGEGPMVDIWAAGSRVRPLRPLPRFGEDVRGTGCQLSSAIACTLAGGMEPIDAVETARRYLSNLLKHHRIRIGQGRSIIVREGSRTGDE